MRARAGARVARRTSAAADWPLARVLADRDARPVTVSVVVALARLERQGAVRLVRPPAGTLTRLRRTANGYQPDTRAVEVADRPPLVGVPEYPARRSAAS